MRRRGEGDNVASVVLDAISQPVIMLGADNRITFANLDAEQFFRSGSAILARNSLDSFLPLGSPLLSLIDKVRSTQVPINEYRVDVSSPKLGGERIVDLYVAPVMEKPGAVVILFKEQTIAEKIDRQMTHRGAARSVAGLASMLAHEIKNPLSGIRGAAQLLEQVVEGDDRALARLITEETDRIVKLVNRMEIFSDGRPIERSAVNIHVVLDHVKAIAQNGFARNIRFIEDYDPSLPPVYANRDQLVQVFLNLIKNAAEAIGDREDGEITLSTAYKPGIKLQVPGARDRVALPLEFCVQDNGSGVPADMLPHLFEPFVTTKVKGSGLGLALVAKIIGDHGGVIECDAHPLRTKFKILMPCWKNLTEDIEIKEFELSRSGPKNDFEA
ncbi:nitrogen regulation protein NR(II) [Falsochrobactrum ovis]|uniref:histidine kinase n=1 Tax=Falsochrobactrum ovis TaxID=1293442 RepID=A0A364JYK9_9HYPH|nr:nitrogen regulation protein NR(II) [Falsochrobactrum ovis]RAK32378.1 two-component system nitrogen regulation sensor histidine kinase GlnL [Falsochrobactrum ovis]